MSDWALLPGLKQHITTTYFYMEDGTMLISEDADIERARQDEAKHTGGFSPFGHGNTQAPFRGVRAAAGLPPAPMLPYVTPYAEPFSGLPHRPESNLRRPDRDLVRFEPTGSVLDDLVFVPGRAIGATAFDEVQKVMNTARLTLAERCALDAALKVLVSLS